MKEAPSATQCIHVKNLSSSNVFTKAAGRSVDVCQAQTSRGQVRASHVTYHAFKETRLLFNSVILNFNKGTSKQNSRLELTSQTLPVNSF